MVGGGTGGGVVAAGGVRVRQKMRRGWKTASYKEGKG